MSELKKKPFSVVVLYTYGVKAEQEATFSGHSLAEVQKAYAEHMAEIKKNHFFRWKSATLYTPTGSHKLTNPRNVPQKTRAERLPKKCQVVKLAIGQAIPETLYALTQGSISLSPAGYPLVSGERVFLRTDKVGKIRMIWQGISCKVYAKKTGKKEYEIHIQRPQEKVPACNKAGWQAQVGVEIIKTKRQKADRAKRLACLEIAG